MKAEKTTALYVRVSTAKQEKGAESQERELKQYCKNHGLNNICIYKDVITGKSTERKGLDKLNKAVFMGEIETIIVWKLDRLSRAGIKEGINQLHDWLSKGIRFISITEQFDFSGHIGQMVASLLFGLSAIEREKISENIRRGIENARAKGVQIGGYKKPILNKQEIVALKKEGMPIASIAEKLNVSRATVYNSLNRT